MSSVAIGEWSRYVVSAAIVAYVVAWLAYCAAEAFAMQVRRAEASVVTTRPEHSRVGGTHSSTGTEGARTVDALEPADRMSRIGFSVLLLATLLLGAGVAMRVIGTGRVPWGNMHEFSITGVLVASVVFVALARSDLGRVLAVWLTLVMFIVLGVAVTILYVPPGPLLPALRSYWLVIHTGAAVLAFGLFTVSAVVSALQIAAGRAERKGLTEGLTGALPASATLDRLRYRLIAIAFPVWTLGPLILGAVWAEVSWGRYWGWDPKEVWALITWLTYAAYLHARATAGWKGSKASTVALVGFATVLFSYFGVNIFFNGLHSYGGV